MRQALRRILLPQPMIEFSRQRFLGGAHRGRVPLLAIRMIERDKSRFAAHRQAHIERIQVIVDGVTQFFNLFPLLFAIRLGDTRRFPDATYAHGVFEFHFAWLDHAADRRCRRWLRRARQRDVALSGEQA